MLKQYKIQVDQGKSTSSKKTERILICYMVPGTGHEKAADAIADSLKQNRPHIRVKTQAMGKMLFPKITTLINYSYIRILKSAPILWETLYDNHFIEKWSKPIRNFVLMISSRKLKKIVSQLQPTKIICTQAVAANAWAYAKRKKIYKGDLECVLTDFTTHQYWVHSEVNVYCVPHMEQKTELIMRGVISTRIKVLPLAVRQEFLKSKNKFSARKKLNLKLKQKTILVMGGSQGLQLTETFRSRHTQVVLACGKNEKTFQTMKNSNPNIKAIAYTDQISDYMDAADLILTKPGGISCAEVMAKQKPLAIFNPLPGQEMRNALFLVRNKLARLVTSPLNLDKLI